MDAHNYPYLRLAAGVLAQAALDAGRADIGAVAWLRSSPAAELVCEALDVDTAQVRSWAAELDLARPGQGGRRRVSWRR